MKCKLRWGLDHAYWANTLRSHVRWAEGSLRVFDAYYFYFFSCNMSSTCQPGLCRSPPRSRPAGSPRSPPEPGRSLENRTQRKAAPETHRHTHGQGDNKPESSSPSSSHAASRETVNTQRWLEWVFFVKHLPWTWPCSRNHPERKQQLSEPHLKAMNRVSHFEVHICIFLHGLLWHQWLICMEGKKQWVGVLFLNLNNNGNALF